MPKIHGIEIKEPRCTKGLSFSRNWNFVKCGQQNFAFFLTSRLHFINICRLQFLVNVFENVNRQFKRTMLLRISSQNVPKN